MVDDVSDKGTAGYRCAMDMPSFVDLQQKVASFSLIKWLLPKEQRKELDKLKAELPRLAALVDDFYSVLGARGWIFHDTLPTSRIRMDVLTRVTADDAEAALCQIYHDQDQLRFMIGQSMQLPDMQPRRHLVERASEDFAAGRYYSAVLVLLTVIDGFVNDVENTHRGLHARDAGELQAWDTPVGHHMGLSATQKSFTKSYSRRVEVEFRDLARNGILHGNITNFDNVLVASKAWNRLFAVIDWARSRDRRDAPKPAEPTWSETMTRLRDTAEMNRSLDAWKPHSGFAAAPDDYEKHPSMLAAAEFLRLWQARNWGFLASLFAPIGKMPEGQAAPAQVRSSFAMYPITGFTIHGYNVQAAAISLVECTLNFDKGSVEASLRMTFVNEFGEPRVEGIDEGTWKMVFRTPEMYAPGILAYANPD